MVELAIVFPVLIGVMLYFWDTMVEIISLQRIESALVQMSLETFDTPIKIINDPVLGSAGIKLRSLKSTSDAINRVANDLKYTLKNSGTGAEYTEFGIMLEMYAVEIKQSWMVGVTPAGYPIKIKINSRRHLKGTSNPDECWDPGDEAEFDAYAARQVTLVKNSLALGYPPIGRKIFKAFVPWMNANIEPYQQYKTFLVMMFCAKPPRVFRSSSVLSFATFIPPKDVGMP